MQNKMVETQNRRVVERGLALLLQSGLTPKYWLYTFFFVIFTFNRLPSKTSNFKFPEFLYSKNFDF